MTMPATVRLYPARRAGVLAVLTFIGALTGTAVAKTIASGLVPPDVVMQHGYVVVSALVAAITWNLITWYYGIPSSSSHALIGGMLGAAMAATVSVGAAVNTGLIQTIATARKKSRDELIGEMRLTLSRFLR